MSQFTHVHPGSQRFKHQKIPNWCVLWGQVLAVPVQAGMSEFASGCATGNQQTCLRVQFQWTKWIHNHSYTGYIMIYPNLRGKTIPTILPLWNWKKLEINGSSWSRSLAHKLFSICEFISQRIPMIFLFGCRCSVWHFDLRPTDQSTFANLNWIIQDFTPKLALRPCALFPQLFRNTRAGAQAKQGLADSEKRGSSSRASLLNTPCSCCFKSDLECVRSLCFPCFLMCFNVFCVSPCLPSIECKFLLGGRFQTNPCWTASLQPSPLRFGELHWLRAGMPRGSRWMEVYSNLNKKNTIGTFANT